MIGLLAVLAVALTLFTIAAVVISFFVHKDKQAFNFQSIFTAYFYLVAMISLVAVFVGAAITTKALLSDVYGRDFSYHYYPEMVEPLETPVKDDSMTDEERQKLLDDSRKQQEERIEAEYQDDLYSGISTFLVGLIFLLVHVFGWRKLEPAKAREGSLFYKGYIILQLVIFSIIALVTLPMGISQWLRYVIQGSGVERGIIPGETLSLAIWATPIWLFFIWWTLRTVRQTNGK